ncbi:MAG TPA: hypothetical protein PKY59_11955, partial [Pyrinomonadaceae bacterium]|nr:hypothetical protein [Pyrinomonadaceae bacterium]
TFPIISLGGDRHKLTENFKRQFEIFVSFCLLNVNYYFAFKKVKGRVKQPRLCPSLFEYEVNRRTGRWRLEKFAFSKTLKKAIISIASDVPKKKSFSLSN